MPSPEIQYTLSSGPLSQIQTGAVLFGLTVSQENESAADRSNDETTSYDRTELFQNLSLATDGLIQRTLEEEAFNAQKDRVIGFRINPGNEIKASRIVFFGCGKIDELKTQTLRKRIQKAVQWALTYKKIEHLTVVMPSSMNQPELFIPFFRAMADAINHCIYHSAEAKEQSPYKLKQVSVLVPENSDTASMEAELSISAALANATSFSKDLTNTPSNIKTTKTMQQAAEEIAKMDGVTLTVQDDTSWIEKNMPSFYAVARGSLASDPPRFLHLVYRHPEDGASRDLKRIAVVGKSVIFDTGGYQIKPTESMLTMKGDMTGGAQALGTIRAIAQLQTRGIELHCYLACTPNKIDSDAFLPDSIIDSASGKKIEIRHTDAEGRLTLIDAVHHALKDKPELIFTVATLTGSARRCLGDNVALLSNQEHYRSRVSAAASVVGDPMQTLDVTEADYEDIKSKKDAADYLNTSNSKTRGTQTAAAFVMHETPKSIPHIHLDIAGVDVDRSEKATGYGQKTVIQHILDLASS